MSEANFNSLDTFIVKFSSLCNLNCSYCYEYNTGDSSWKTKPKYFSRENAEQLNLRLKEYLKITGHEFLNIVGHGGEPLLLGPEKLDDLFGKITAGLEDKVKLSIQTNAVLVTEEIISILKKYNVRCGVSLDGNVHHNKHRVNHSGKSSFSDTLNGYYRLSNEGLVSGILCVTDFDNDPVEVVDFLCSLNPAPLQIDFLHPFVNHDHPKGIRLLGEEYKRWFIGAFDHYMNHSDYHLTRVRLFESALFSFFSGKSNSDWFGGQLGRYLVIETDGNYDILDHLKSIGSFGKTFSDLRMNIFNNSLTEAYHRIKHVLSVIKVEQAPDLCCNCSFVKSCNGGYYPTRYSSVNNSLNNPSAYCKGLYDLFEHLTAKYQQFVISNVS